MRLLHHQPDSVSRQLRDNVNQLTLSGAMMETYANEATAVDEAHAREIFHVQFSGDLVKHNGKEPMARRKLLLFVMVSMLMPALMACTGIPQGNSKAASATSTKALIETIAGCTTNQGAEYFFIHKMEGENIQVQNHRQTIVGGRRAVDGWDRLD
jgi:hypothetical protein